MSAPASPDNAAPEKAASAPAAAPVTNGSVEPKPASASGKPRVWFKDPKTGRRKERTAG